MRKFTKYPSGYIKSSSSGCFISDATNMANYIYNEGLIDKVIDYALEDIYSDDIEELYNTPDKFASYAVDWLETTLIGRLDEGFFTIPENIDVTDIMRLVPRNVITELKAKAKEIFETTDLGDY